MARISYSSPSPLGVRVGATLEKRSEQLQSLSCSEMIATVLTILSGNWGKPARTRCGLQKSCPPHGKDRSPKEMGKPFFETRFPLSFSVAFNPLARGCCVSIPSEGPFFKNLFLTGRAAHPLFDNVLYRQVPCINDYAISPCRFHRRCSLFLP